MAQFRIRPNKPFVTLPPSTAMKYGHYWRLLPECALISIMRRLS